MSRTREVLVAGREQLAAQYGRRRNHKKLDRNICAWSAITDQEGRHLDEDAVAALCDAIGVGCYLDIWEAHDELRVQDRERVVLGWYDHALDIIEDPDFVPAAERV